jgi:hypothetical protein
VKQIPLNRGLFALVDDEDYDKLSPFTWYVAKAPLDFLYISRSLYDSTRRKDKPKGKGGAGKVIMVREILGLAPGDKRLVYQKDRNFLNCQKNNLLIVDYTFSGLNKKLGKNNTTGYKGVYYNRRKRAWVAYIYYHRKAIYLGHYKTAPEAGEAYSIARDNLILKDYLETTNHDR